MTTDQQPKYYCCTEEEAQEHGLATEDRRTVFHIPLHDLICAVENLHKYGHLDDMEIPTWDELTDAQQEVFLTYTQSHFNDDHNWEGFNTTLTEAWDSINAGGPPAETKANCRWCGNPIEGNQPFIETQTVGFDPIGAIPFPAVATFYHQEDCYDASQAQRRGDTPG